MLPAVDDVSVKEIAVSRFLCYIVVISIRKSFVIASADLF